MFKLNFFKKDNKDTVEEAQIVDPVTEAVSPLPTKKGDATTYDFPGAMKAVIDGRKITRIEWNTNDIYCLLHDGRLMLFKDARYFEWIVNDGDLLAKDWVLLPEAN